MKSVDSCGAGDDSVRPMVRAVKVDVGEVGSGLALLVGLRRVGSRFGSALGLVGLRGSFVAESKKGN